MANQTTLKMYDEKARIDECSEMATPETSKNASAKAAEIVGSTNSKHQKSATQQFKNMNSRFDEQASGQPMMHF